MGYSHSDIGHNWAHQLKSRQGDRHFSFDGRKIMSYTTVIGEIVHTNDGTPVYFLNTGSYSNSTSKHQGHAFSAIPDDAVQFSASSGDFIFRWNGMTYWKDEMTESQAKEFVAKNLQHVVDSLLEFKTSKALKIEKEFSLHCFDEAVRFLQYFPLTSISKILRMKNSKLKDRYDIDNPTCFRKVVKAIMAGDRELKSLVDIANGKGTYDDYCHRTQGIRATESTRQYNHWCGFETVGYRGDWYEPYPYVYGMKNGSRWPKNNTYISHALHNYCGKGFTSKQILQHRENGDLIEVLLNAKKQNFATACETFEVAQRSKRIKEAKKRLELLIGLRGWDNTWSNNYKRVIFSFNYNGTIYTFNRWNEECELSSEEYMAFSSMSPDKQKEFIRAKRSEMLEILRQQDYDYQHRYELAEKARIQREKEQVAKREYIEHLKAQGDEGIRQLWHEGLISSTSLWDKPVTMFYGGNVLLRVADDGKSVITSKGITISLNECKRLWRIINRWHDNNTEFCSSDEVVHASKKQQWQIQRYQNDIMIAGCHAIAYREMATIAKQLNFC